jgi:protein-S-isoprenylcysteine O-methyltransferase
MAVPEVKFAICTFVFYLFLVLYICFDQTFSVQQWTVSVKPLLGFIVTLLLFCLPYSQVTKRSAFLGCVFGAGILFNLEQYYFNVKYLGWYLCSLSFFHFSEYIMTALYNADKLSVDSFLLNHSLEYKVAAVASWFEFLIELYLFPVVKRQFIFSFVGLSMVIFGEMMRKLAMTTAKSNFTHLIQFTKRDQHILVTWGIYSWCRHPGYVGWFYWSVGTVTCITHSSDNHQYPLTFLKCPSISRNDP